METGRISEGSGLSPGVLSSVSDKEKSGRVQARESYSVSGLSKPPLTDSRKRFFRSFFQRLTRTATLLVPAPNPPPEGLSETGVPRARAVARSAPLTAH